jgi:hypothetical protein
MRQAGRGSHRRAVCSRPGILVSSSYRRQRYDMVDGSSWRRLSGPWYISRAGIASPERLGFFCDASDFRVPGFAKYGA